MIDARTLSNGTILDFDVCIIGSGPAGLAAASGFLGSSLKVAIVDAGGLTEARDDLGQTAAKARMEDVEYITHIQRVGGNAHAWTIGLPNQSRMSRFGRFHGSDIAARPGFGLMEPWPISDEELADFHARAATFWELPPPPVVSPDSGEIDLGPDIATTHYQFSNARTLLNTVISRLQAASNIEIVTFAQAQSFTFEGSSETVTGVNTRVEPGRDIVVRAGQFIIAMGCINSTRLLLNSVTPKGHAPGNSNDLLGRYLMDHPLLDGGVLRPRDKSLFNRLRPFDIHMRDGGACMAHFHIAADTLLRDSLPDLSCILLPHKEGQMNFETRSPRRRHAHDAALAIRDAINRREGLKVKDFVTAAMGADEVVRKGIRKFVAPQPNLGSGGWTTRSNPEKRFDAFQVLHITEQPPRADNRLFLSAETDSNGMRRCDISWKFHDEDKLDLMRSQKIFAAAVAASGLGTVEIAHDNGRPVVLSAAIGHHLGTTRMHTDPAKGVVDENCCVHGTGNLYVASGSVFPSGGYMNPTFTISALALRIADHIRAKRAA